MKILIVDDNESVRRLVASIVRPVAEEVRECVGGRDAVEAYQSQRPDVVLMDLRMKDGDGIATTRELRIADPAAKVVIVTDYDDEELRKAALAAGACEYALKENLPDLLRLLRNVTT